MVARRQAPAAYGGNPVGRRRSGRCRSRAASARRSFSSIQAGWHGPNGRPTHASRRTGCRLEEHENPRRWRCRDKPGCVVAGWKAARIHPFATRSATAQEGSLHRQRGWVGRASADAASGQRAGAALVARQPYDRRRRQHARGRGRHRRWWDGATGCSSWRRRCAGRPSSTPVHGMAATSAGTAGSTAGSGLVRCRG